jgi:hypothetical protein
MRELDDTELEQVAAGKTLIRPLAEISTITTLSYFALKDAAVNRITG